MLTLLADYATTQRLETEPGFRSKFVRWAIELNSKTGYLQVTELGDISQKRNRGREFLKCPDLSQPELIAGGKSKCHFLIETTNVIALFNVGDEDNKTKEKHGVFIKMLFDAGQEIPSIAFISQVLQDMDTVKRIQNELQIKKAKPSDKLTFQLDGDFIVDSEVWHDWWRAFRNSIKSNITSNSHRIEVNKKPKLMRCYVTGELIKPVTTHTKIIGLVGVGGQPGGDSLISFDKEAFRSFGLEQSENAAVSEVGMSAYVAGLNSLIQKYSYTFANSKFVYWFMENVDDKNNPFLMLLEDRQQLELPVQNLMRQLLGRPQTDEFIDLGKNRYYGLIISGAAGRVMVRDYMEGSFSALTSNVQQWFEDIEIISLSGYSHAKLLGMERIITSLMSPRKPGQNYEDWIKPVSSERLTLLHAAINGSIIPFSILCKVVIENKKFILSGEFENLLDSRTDDASTHNYYSIIHARMSLIKAYHLRKQKKEGNTMQEIVQPNLNENYPDPAYQCGRLLAVLAELQRAALGDVSGGIIQRYYAAASITPTLVLGRLIRNSQFHLTKLQFGLARWFENKIIGITNNLKNGIPAAFSLEEQSLFALGYYQQMADLYTPKSKKSQITNEQEHNNDEPNYEPV